MNSYLILWSLALVALLAGDEFFYRRFRSGMGSEE